METVVCDLCGLNSAHTVLRQRDLLFCSTEEEFTVVRCGGCGLLYLNPRPTEAEIERYYPKQYFGSPALPRRFSRIRRWIMEDYYGYPTSGPRTSWHRVRKLLLWPEKVRRTFCGIDIIPWIGQGRFLDVGCGPGVNLKICQQQGWVVYGVEVSETAVAQAREFVGDCIYAGTLEHATFEEECFDVILFSHSLEHVFSPVKELAHVQRLLKPGGMLVITVPNAGSLEAWLFGRWWVPWDPPRHLYHFEKASLAKLLEEAGFRVVRLRTGVGSMYFLASLERFWQHRFGRAIRLRRVIEKLIAKPFSLLVGNLGYGTEIKVQAIKKQSVIGCDAAGMNGAVLEQPCG